MSTTPYFTKVNALTRPPMTVRSGGHKICTTKVQHDAAVKALQPGDWIDCRGITFPGEVIYTNKLSGYAKITYDSLCKFTGIPGSNLPALYAKDISHLQLLFNGGSVINPKGGAGILAHKMDNCVIDGFKVHDCGGGGVNLLPALGDIRNCFVRGEVWNIGLVVSYDPHAEKGTGLHCCLVADAAGGTFHHNNVAIFGHDCGNPERTKGGGSVIQIGDPAAIHAPHDNNFYVKAKAMHYLAQIQSGGNGVNLWGYIASAALKYIEAEDLMGRAVQASGTQTWTAVKVEAGTAANCCQNPKLPRNPWDKTHGVQYGAVTPAP